MKKGLIICLFSICFSCTESAEKLIPFVEGYWEIIEVKKDGEVLKTYTVNTTVDYFKVNEDLTGFRKKVAPSFDGSFSVTEDEIPFSLIVENGKLYITYNNRGLIFREHIKMADQKAMIIVNDDGFTYSYKPFEKIQIKK